MKHLFALLALSMGTFGCYGSYEVDPSLTPVSSEPTAFSGECPVVHVSVLSYEAFDGPVLYSIGDDVRMVDLSGYSLEELGEGVPLGSHEICEAVIDGTFEAYSEEGDLRGELVRSISVSREPEQFFRFVYFGER